MEHPEYYELREHLIGFLEIHARRKHNTPTQSPPPPSGPATHSADVVPKTRSKVEPAASLAIAALQIG